jgi:Flp pilus assembly protein TadG
MNRSTLRRPTRRAQGLIEFALTVVLFCFLLFGALDFGRVVWSGNVLAAAAAEAARFAVVHGGSFSTQCPVGPPAPGLNIPPASTDCPHPSPSTQAIKDRATATAIAVGGPVTVAVCYGDGCQGNTNSAGASNIRGTPLTVTVSATVSLVLPALLGQGDFPLSSSTTTIVSH